MIKLIIVDDFAREIKGLLDPLPCLQRFAKDYYDCSNIHPIPEYNQGDLSPAFDLDEIRVKTKQSLEALLDGDGPWLILLDYQICRSTKSKDDYWNINHAVHMGVVDAIAPRENAYLILYSSVAPSLVSELYDRLAETISDPENGIAMHLYHIMLNISFFAEPANYKHIANQQIRRELMLIEKGEISDVRWPSAAKLRDD